ncbi:PqqD family protein [Desulfopila inferna]|uniref:PqqD family protein n=1 Tax=Desulfopila inferna TaxID=468528 RepID=UPI001963A197|nr:PqqD family protein [Desulfopila inferna]MBM9605786.1 PqqD family protein [Desulfopila inferna]
MKNIDVPFKRKDSIVERQVAGETFLVPINQTGADLQKVYVLNETASVLWSKLENFITLRELAAALHEEYNSPEQKIYQDIGPLVKEFFDRDFLDLIDN